MLGSDSSATITDMLQKLAKGNSGETIRPPREQDSREIADQQAIKKLLELQKKPQHTPSLYPPKADDKCESVSNGQSTEPQSQSRRLGAGTT